MSEIKRPWTPGPWEYRPDEFDDWGVVSSGHYHLCRVRDPRVPFEISRHLFQLSAKPVWRACDVLKSNPTRVNYKLRGDARKVLADSQVAAYMLSNKLARTTPLNAHTETSVLEKCKEIRKAKQTLFAMLERVDRSNP